MKKAITARVEETAIARMKAFCSELGQSEADFLTDAITYYCDAVRHERSGGMSLTIPNPQFSIADDESKEKAVAILSKAAAELTENNAGLEFGMHYIAGFALERLFRDTEAQKKAFSEQLKAD